MFSQPSKRTHRLLADCKRETEEANTFFFNSLMSQPVRLVFFYCESRSEAHSIIFSVATRAAAGVHPVPRPASVQSNQKRGVRLGRKQAEHTVRSTGCDAKIVPQYGIESVF